MPPAVRAVHTLDNELSAEVVNGLLAYDFIYQTSVSDELGNILGQGSANRAESASGWRTPRGSHCLGPEYSPARHSPTPGTQNRKHEARLPPPLAPDYPVRS